MICSIKSPAQRRWVNSCWVSALLVVLLSAAAALSFRFGHLKGPLAYPVAVLPALPILWLLLEMWRYVVAEKDEFLRLLFVQCLLGGTGGTLATTTVWGWLEAFRLAPHMAPTMVYALFWIFVAVSYPVVYARYR